MLIVIVVACPLYADLTVQWCHLVAAASKIDRPINKPNGEYGQKKLRDGRVSSNRRPLPKSGILMSTYTYMLTHMPDKLNLTRGRHRRHKWFWVRLMDIWLDISLSPTSACIRMCSLGLLCMRSTSLNFNFIVYLMVAASIMARWFLLNQPPYKYIRTYICYTYCHCHLMLLTCKCCKSNLRGGILSA